MGLLTFKGGLHPYDGKELSKDKPITEYLPQGELVYPLSQHIGAPAVACVKKGDRVLVGQKIAEAGGFVSANIYSSVSGTVKKIEPRMTVSGNKVNAVVVENDGEYETVSFQPVTEKTNEAIINAVKEAGIVGLGGAGFPTHVKLSPKEPDKIDTIIINAAECEPYITADYRCMMEIPEQLISGLNIMLSLFPKAKGVIGIEDNKPEAIAKLTEMCKSESRIEVAALKTKYPQGAERSLIYAVTGRAINSSMLPADAGCIGQLTWAGRMPRTIARSSCLPLLSRSDSSSGAESKWSSMARLLRPVTKIRSVMPAATASSTAYWISGLSTTGSISLGIALVAGRKRVPMPATGKTALRTGRIETS